MNYLRKKIDSFKITLSSCPTIKSDDEYYYAAYNCGGFDPINAIRNFEVALEDNKYVVTETIVLVHEYLTSDNQYKVYGNYDDLLNEVNEIDVINNIDELEIIDEYAIKATKIKYYFEDDNNPYLSKIVRIQ